ATDSPSEFDTRTSALPTPGGVRTVHSVQFSVMGDAGAPPKVIRVSVASVNPRATRRTTSPPSSDPSVVERLDIVGGESSTNVSVTSCAVIRPHRWSYAMPISGYTVGVCAVGIGVQVVPFHSHVSVRMSGQSHPFIPP